MPVSYACIARGADGILSEFSTTENQQWSERAVKMVKRPSGSHVMLISRLRLNPCPQLKKATDVADGKKLTFIFEGCACVSLFGSDGGLCLQIFVQLPGRAQLRVSVRGGRGQRARPAVRFLD